MDGNTYSITKNPIPIILRTVGIVLASDTLYLFALFLLIAFRNIAGIDATLLGVGVLMFIIKTLITMFGVYTALNAWLRTTYIVSSKELIIYSTSRLKPSQSFNKSEIRSIKVDKTGLGSKLNYGNIRVKFSNGSFKEEVVLRDIREPELVATNIKN